MINTPSVVEPVSFARSAESPPEGAPNTLVMRFTGGGGVNGPVVLHGSYNLGVDLAGRYSGNLPQPVRVVAVSRATGRVHSRLLLRSEDQPPTFLGDAAPPSVVRTSPGRPSKMPITEGGAFSVDMKRHLSWPDAADEFDVFLWIDGVASDLAHVRKAAEPGSNPGAAEFERPTRVALVKPAPSASGPRLSAGSGKAIDRSLRQIHGSGGAGRTSVVAYAQESGVVGWTVVGTEDSGPIEFSIDVARLLPGARPNERVYAFALGGGKRSELLVLPPGR